MRKINVPEDIIPIGEFKTHASKGVERLFRKHADVEYLAPPCHPHDGLLALLLRGPRAVQEVVRAAYAHERERLEAEKKAAAERQVAQQKAAREAAQAKRDEVAALRCTETSACSRPADPAS